MVLRYLSVLLLKVESPQDTSWNATKGPSGDADGIKQSLCHASIAYETDAASPLEIAH
jgi:hypothetical protein